MEFERYCDDLGYLLVVQSLRLHETISLLFPLQVPPFFASVIIFLLRVLKASEPHVAVHSDSLHSLQVQLTANNSR